MVVALIKLFETMSLDNIMHIAEKYITYVKRMWWIMNIVSFASNLMQTFYVALFSFSDVMLVYNYFGGVLKFSKMICICLWTSMVYCKFLNNSMWSPSPPCLSWSVFKFGSDEFECSMSMCSGYLCFMWATRVLGCFMSVGKWNLRSFRFKRTLELHGGFLLIFLYA